MLVQLVDNMIDHSISQNLFAYRAAVSSKLTTSQLLCIQHNVVSVTDAHYC